ncbi:MAG: hypothetical protein WC635_05200 [Bacteriovorax sp.]|jgi:hypothetical protein
MKVFIVLLAASFSISAFACPQLQGRYNKCHSEIRQVKGEYIIDQHQENFYEVYDIQYIDDETGESRNDQLKTDNKIASRKETLPRMGVTVRIEAKTSCENNAVVSVGDAYFFGARVGSFTTRIFREGKLLKSNLDGSYLGKEAHKRIVCELE